MRKASKGLGALLATYLLLGMMFAVSAQPQQMWVCPAPKEPHGTISYDTRRSPECRASVTPEDRIEHFVFATVFGIPAVVIKGLNPDS